MSINAKHAPRVKLVPNAAKIIAAISYIIEEASARHQQITQYDIVKTLFLSDRGHLNEYGRPITFDNYIAMLHGPVPSFAYDLLKGNSRALQRLNVKSLPWEMKKRSNKIFYAHKKQYDLSVLSKSDKDHLSNALTNISSLTFGQIRRLTHEDPAYKEAWLDDNSSKGHPMSYGMLFEVPDFEAAEALAVISKHQ